MKTIVIKISAGDDYNYTVEVDNGVTVTHITTAAPQQTILSQLAENGVKGKRGRKVGQKNAPKVKADGPFSAPF